MQIKHEILALPVMMVFLSSLLAAQPIEPVKSVPSAGKVVALTFDDGIVPEVHKRILKTLKEESVPATFFFIGNKLSEEKLVRETINDAHEIGNHTMSHPVLPQLKTAQIEEEIIGFQDVMKKEFGYCPKAFRAPKLQCDKRVLQILAEESLIPINATVGTTDYEDTTSVNFIIEAATKSPRLVPGSIILMHELLPKSADALPAIIAYYKKNGYRFVTVSALIEKAGAN